MQGRMASIWELRWYFKFIDMIKLIFLSAILLMVVQESYSQKNADKIIGRWMSTENNLEVEIFRVDDCYDAKVIWIDDSDDKSKPMDTRCDFRNPDEALRKRKIIGLVVMKGLVFNRINNDWDQGRIYDPHSGKNWDAMVALTKAGYLKVRGYWGFQLLGKDLLFRKIFATNVLTTTR